MVLIYVSSVHSARADNSTRALHLALATIDSNTEQVVLIGYQSIAHEKPDGMGATRYIILDFRPDDNSLGDEEMVTTVSVICTQITSNWPLIKNLSALGYDMVSVAFDDHNQFDCL